MRSHGILVGANQSQEWLLPWWWQHLRHQNPRCEVAFADFGLSKSGKRWCEQRGVVLSVPEAKIALKDELDPKQAEDWESLWKEKNEGDFWGLRHLWFKKPLAMKQTPFQRTIWMDLDCEVRGDLSFLFNYPLYFAKLTACVSSSIYCEKQWIPLYNSGVVVFEHDSMVLSLWNDLAQEESRYARTEEELLSHIVHSCGMAELPLPAFCNWDAAIWGPHSDALIHHWKGSKGKEKIRQMLTLRDIV
jgi:hypothetical protein